MYYFYVHQSPYALLLAASTLTKLVTRNTTSLSIQDRLQLSEASYWCANLCREEWAGEGRENYLHAYLQVWKSPVEIEEIFCHVLRYAAELLLRAGLICFL